MTAMRMIMTAMPARSSEVTLAMDPLPGAPEDASDPLGGPEDEPDHHGQARSERDRGPAESVGLDQNENGRQRQPAP
jgi:hypothetical protein